MQVLRDALADPEWAVRVRAATLLQSVDPETPTADKIRPAPTRGTGEQYTAPHVISPPFSTELHLDTDRGAIRIELAVLDAPQTVETLTSLVRDGFYDGVTFHRVLMAIWVAVGLAGPVAAWIAWRREWRWAYLLSIAVICSPVALYKGLLAFFAMKAFLER